MNLKTLSPLALSASIAVSSFAFTPVAQAEVSASLTLSSMYLWRGTNLTPDGPSISGSLDYSNESGVYAGIWTTNETGGSETDLYIGYAGEAGDFSYDVSFWEYLYPEDTDGAGAKVDLMDNALSEIVLGGGYGDFGASVTLSSETQGGSDYTYITLDYTIEKYNILYGMWSFDEAGNNEYSHVTLTYSYDSNSRSNRKTIYT